ncbi:MAG TPA: hypothetical protein VLX68_00310 [Chitinivibrionales bacterium]|nr:hypothetical protein [Chitinivibrionales bacterium]
MINFRNAFFVIIASVVTAFLCTCGTPFFPLTGEPEGVTTGRTTPAGTVMQLFQAYETRQINLFSDLFSPTKDFRFYVRQGFQPDYSGKPVRDVETIDTAFEYIWKRGITQAYYWTYDEEIQIHNNLFSQATEIFYQVQPEPIDTNNIVYLQGPDGTEYAEVIVRGGVMEIDLKTDYDRVINEYIVDIDVQVFYLERDPTNSSLWVIAKWFDLPPG